MDSRQRRQIQFSVGYVILALIGIWVFQALIFRPMIIRWQEVPYSQFRSELADGNIEDVTLGPDRIYYTCCTPPEGDQPGQVYNAVRVDDKDLIVDLVAAGVTFRAQPPTSGLLPTLLGWIIPLLPLALIYFFLFRRMGQGGAGVMSIGKSKAREIAGEMTGVKFADVGGVDEVEVELKEILDFLKDQERFRRLGAKLPKGVLLVGPPGTGKTLLARATAGEAGVPFFSISGSDFVEMFVGVGAARVRDLFEQAKAKAPCIVFIDEIDAIGQSRARVGVFAANDEREQTLNQLLSEMDGFEPNVGVIIMAATNRPEILDQALLRPGRFDRQVQVTLPTEEGRAEILRIHAKHVVLAPDADLDRIAQITPGFSGADLANIVNEAALLAARRSAGAVSMVDLDLAIERVVAGLQRKMPLRDEVKRKVAYHEAGHALVAQVMPRTDQVHKVSIIPTAKGALGYTMQMPEEDQYLLGAEELRERMAVMLAGRASELIVFGEASTGASNDLERATELARRMVTEFGMTEALGPVRYAEDPRYSYLGTSGNLRQDLAPETASAIDAEIRKLVSGAQDQATGELEAHMEQLHEIATVLIDREVILHDEIQAIVEKARE